MKDILFNYKTEHKPTKGCLLISEPHLPDYNFERSVIYLCEHNEKGSFGLVLNKISEYNLSDLFFNIDLKISVGIGGPVENNTLHYLYRNLPKIKNSIEVGENIYLGGNFEEIINKTQYNEKEVLFFIGYSGWTKGQLQEEVDSNSWIIFPNAPENLIFEVHKKNLWKETLIEMGGKFSVFANYPSDPRLN